MRPALCLASLAALAGCTAADPLVPDSLPVLRAPTITLTARLNGTPVTFEGFAFLRETADGGLTASLSVEECGLARPFTYRGLVRRLSVALPAPVAVRTYAAVQRRWDPAPAADSAYVFAMDSAGDAVAESYRAAPDLRVTVVTYDPAGGYVSGAVEGTLAPERRGGPAYRFEGGRFSGRFERLGPNDTPQSTVTRCYQGPGG